MCAYLEDNIVWTDMVRIMEEFLVTMVTVEAMLLLVDDDRVMVVVTMVMKMLVMELVQGLAI